MQIYHVKKGMHSMKKYYAYTNTFLNENDLIELILYKITG